MHVGMTLPVMEPDLDAATLREWAVAIDQGPYSALCFGERMAFDNPDALTLLGAVAAWTERVRLVTTIIVPQLHDPVMLAKALATGDMLSQGRLTVGVGVGGREEDYRAAGADPATQTKREMSERVAVMKRVWAGENVTGATRPVGPPPVQDGGPQILVGTMGPKTLADAAHWADGLAGTTMDLNLDDASALYDLARESWAAAGRGVPQLTTSFWFALAQDEHDTSAREQVRSHLVRYMNWLPARFAEKMGDTAGFAGTEEQLREVLRGFARIGTDEIQLIPTGSDVEQVHRVSRIVAEEFGVATS